jgi:hypothetical protein
MPQNPKKPTTKSLGKSPAALQAAQQKSKGKAISVDIANEVQAAAKALAPAAARLAKALGQLNPKGLPVGAVSDLLYDLRAVKTQVPNLAAPFDDALGPVIKLLEDYFVDTLAVGESSGVQGMHSRVQVTEKVVPTVAPEDWPKFYAYMAKTKSWELLNKAINAKAVQERWDAKKQVPGVKPFHVKRVSCTKIGGK